MLIKRLKKLIKRSKKLNSIRRVLISFRSILNFSIKSRSKLINIIATIGFRQPIWIANVDLKMIRSQFKSIFQPMSIQSPKLTRRASSFETIQISYIFEWPRPHHMYVCFLCVFEIWTPQHLDFGRLDFRQL